MTHSPETSLPLVAPRPDPAIQPEVLPGYRPCAGIMVLNPAGRVFVGHRPGTPADCWQMPQGGIDPGESPFEAARRELYEETGMTGVEWLAGLAGWIHYDLPPELVGKALGGKYAGQAQQWFLARLPGDNPRIRIDLHVQEFDTWCWLPPGQLEGAAIAFKRGVYRLVVQAFSPGTFTPLPGAQTG